MRSRPLSLAPRTWLLGIVGATLLSAPRPVSAAWPPSPGADMRDEANWPNDPSYKDAWNYWSFLPAQAAGAPARTPLDEKLGASGMHIDEAWQKTTGADAVVVAVFDSGIYWENPDLVARYVLNGGELQGPHAPTQADGSACGGTGALAGLDCDGSGTFDIRDYAADPRMTGVVPGEKCFTDGARTTLGPDRARGDLNRNCILDPGDLILAFSDGKDDDGNGYKDDISGWDFLHDDNDAYDDTRYGHGNGESEGVAAEGNNSIDGIGVCPKCRILPIRTGESYIADSTDFAQGAVYAADYGASIFNIALGTINQTSASKASIDYAYSKGVLVVTSMADENSRHHNMPATTNHTLTVHSVRYDAESWDEASTFVHFDRCSNFGGQMSLSISATSCSSEATEKTSGMAGLLLSYARSKNVHLTPNEAMQIFRQTADDIDNPDSRTPGGSARYYFSQPGFEQRFGYGRPHARRMLDLLDTGKIPPEVDITSPEWFDVVHAAKSPTLALRGTVRAARATSVDVVVEWAPGVEPTESLFRPIANYPNVPGSTTLGADAPLATLDTTALDTTHTRDADSPLGENDRTVTLRVRATAHYPSGDVSGDARRTFALSNAKNGGDPDLLPGFPLKLNTSVDGDPKLVDLDGDGKKEIVLTTSDGRLHAFDGSDPTREKAGFPYKLSLADGLNKDLGAAAPDYTKSLAYQPSALGTDLFRESAINAPAFGDLDNDGKKEIVVSAWNGTIYAVHSDGSPLAGYPKRLPAIGSCPLDHDVSSDAFCMDASRNLLRGSNASPVLADLNGDGHLDIIFGGFDGLMHAWDFAGNELSGFPVSVQSAGSRGRARIMSTAAVGDLNGDGVFDIVTGSNQMFGDGGYGEVTAIDGRGNNAPQGATLPHWPVRITAMKLFPVVGEGVAAASAIGDLDLDGKPEVIVQGNGGGPLVFHADPGIPQGSTYPGRYLPGKFLSVLGGLSEAPEGTTFLPLLSQPSLGDLDQDGHPDVIASGASLSLALALQTPDKVRSGQFLLAAWRGTDGYMLPGAPMILGDYTFFVNHAVGDISGDGYPEIVTGTGGYLLHAVDGCGREPAGWPKFTGGWVTGTAALGDINGDGKRDVVVGTREGYLYAWSTKALTGSPLEWDSFHHDERNTGNMATPVGEAIVRKPSSPLECTAPQVPDSDGSGAVGGGTCATAPDSRPSALPAFLLLGALGSCIFARRRSRPSAM